MGDSYMSRGSADEDGEGGEEESMIGSMVEDEEADDEYEEEEEEEADEEAAGRRLNRADVVEAELRAQPPSVVVQDFDAVVITGIKNLMVKKEQDPPAEQ